MDLAHGPPPLKMRKERQYGIRWCDLSPGHMPESSRKSTRAQAVHEIPAHSGKTPGPSTGDITGLLLVWGRGDDKALEELIPLVYEELRRPAGRAAVLRHGADPR